MADDPSEVLPYVGDDPAALRTAAERLGDARARLARAGDTLFDARAALGRAWVGTSAAVADEQLRLIGSATEHGALRLDSGRRAVLGCAEELAGVRAGIDDLRDRWPRGWILPAEFDPANGQLRAALLRDWADHAERADAATDACRRRLIASITDGEASGAGLGAALGLDALVVDDQFRAGVGSGGDAVAEWAALGAAARRLLLAGAGPFPPPSAVNPAAVAGAWAALTPLQQEALVRLRPTVVGALDGLPAEARDQANRIVLAGAIEDRRLMLADATAQGDADLVAEIERQLTGMEAVSGVLAERTVAGVPTPVYLMSVDQVQADRVVVAVGDPDSADSVGVFVPGTGTDLGSVSGNVERASAMLAATRGAGVADAAVVMWLGYDAPANLPEAAADGAAAAGAAPFARFLNGLRAAHLGVEPASVTAVLHSYAVLLGAQAAAGQPLDVDQLVFVGGTGTELGSAAEIQLAGVAPEAVGARIVAVTTATDPILFTGGVHPGMAQDPAFGVQTMTVPGPPLGIGDLALNTATDGLFGVVPGLAGMLGAGVPTPSVWDADAHSGYFSDPAVLDLIGQLIARRFP